MKDKTAGNTHHCPYCGILFSLNGVSADYSFPKFGRFHPYATSDATAELPPECKKQYSITSHRCPECHQQIMWLTELMSDDTEGPAALLFPKNPVKLVPPEVPPQFAADFREAHDTLSVSPKASAALSRRCLQMLIRDHEKITEKTLFAEVGKLIKLN